MSYDGLSITGTRLIIVLFCFPHSKSRRVPKKYCLYSVCNVFCQCIWQHNFLWHH